MDGSHNTIIYHIMIYYMFSCYSIPYDMMFVAATGWGKMDGRNYWLVENSWGEDGIIIILLNIIQS